MYNKGLLLESGKLTIGRNAEISDDVVFLPDRKGGFEKVIVGDNATIRSGAKIFSGTHIGDRAEIEENVIIGHPEKGYATARVEGHATYGHTVYDGSGDITYIDEDAIIRSNAIVYAGAKIGRKTHIAHGVLIRTKVSIGERTFVGHNTIIERETVVGKCVRFSPLCHITGYILIEEYAFIGAGVVTINDKSMYWMYNMGKKSENSPVTIRRGARIGSGATLGAGVEIGEQAMIGSCSLVLKSIPKNMIAYGVPAKIIKERSSDDLLNFDELSQLDESPRY